MNKRHFLVTLVVSTGQTHNFGNLAHVSPVILWFDLDKIATETLFVGNDSHTHPEQHFKNIEQSK